MYLRNGRVGVFDLSAKSAGEEELPGGDDLRSLALAESLMAEHGEGALVLGTGALTASFVPAACAGFILTKDRLMPLLGFAAVELKLSGFDFVVVKGRAARRGYLWIRDGMMELVDSQPVASGNAWKRTDAIRSEQGDTKIQILSVGPWGDASSDAAQMVVNYWGGEDKVGMGAELGRRGLCAIAFRGMGELELAEPEKHFEDSLLLMSEHIKKLDGNDGLASYSGIVARDDFRSLVHRHVACYGCPYPCRSYLKVHEDPKELRLMSKEPGYLHYDLPALEKAFELGFDARTATLAMIECAKAGADPVSLMALASQGSAEASLEPVRGLLVRPSMSANARAGNFEASFSSVEPYRSCLDLGVCPRYWSKVGFDFEAVAEYARPALGDRGPA